MPDQTWLEWIKRSQNTGLKTLRNEALGGVPGLINEDWAPSEEELAEAGLANLPAQLLGSFGPIFATGGLGKLIGAGGVKAGVELGIPTLLRKALGRALSSRAVPLAFAARNAVENTAEQFKQMKGPVNVTDVPEPYQLPPRPGWDWKPAAAAAAKGYITGSMNLEGGLGSRMVNAAQAAAKGIPLGGLEDYFMHAHTPGEAIKNALNPTKAAEEIGGMAAFGAVAPPILGLPGRLLGGKPQARTVSAPATAASQTLDQNLTRQQAAKPAYAFKSELLPQYDAAVQQWATKPYDPIEAATLAAEAARQGHWSPPGGDDLIALNDLLYRREAELGKTTFLRNPQTQKLEQFATNDVHTQGTRVQPANKSTKAYKTKGWIGGGGEEITENGRTFTPMTPSGPEGFEAIENGEKVVIPYADVPQFASRVATAFEKAIANKVRVPRTPGAVPARRAVGTQVGNSLDQFMRIP